MKDSYCQATDIRITPYACQVYRNKNSKKCKGCERAENKFSFTVDKIGVVVLTFEDKRFKSASLDFSKDLYPMDTWRIYNAVHEKIKELEEKFREVE